MSKICIVPIPIELIVVVSGTLISRYCDLPKIYNIEIVGHIPTGYVLNNVLLFKFIKMFSLFFYTYLDT